MLLAPSDRPRTRRTRVVVLAATVGLLPAVAGGAASGSPSRVGAAPGRDVAASSAGHAYRHGIVPKRISSAAIGSPAPAGQTSGSSGRLIRRRPLTYGGGPVVTGNPKVYLVFWGSQWGNESTTGGHQVFSGDPVGAATNLEAFFTGLGTNGELWSTMAARYCQRISIGAVSCPLSAARVPYPNGGVLAGVWEDTSFTPPTGPPGSPSTKGVTATQIAQEAADASVHFADTSTNAQYVIFSPTGTNPDGWNNPRTGYCAYHGSTGGFGVSGPDVAYTNMPYVTDAGQACSAGLPATPANSDAVTEVEGHEYYETLTDGFQTTAWLDAAGQEIGDKCENLGPGGPGGYFDLTLATGTFGVQGMWANSANGGRGGCVDAQSPILVDNPGTQVMRKGTAVNLPITAADVLPGQTLTYSTGGLPVGLSINAASGVISGVPTARGRGTVTVTVADGSNSADVVFTVIVRR